MGAYYSSGEKSFESPRPNHMQILTHRHSGTVMHAHTNEGFLRAGDSNYIQASANIAGYF